MARSIVITCVIAFLSLTGCEKQESKAPVAAVSPKIIESSETEPETSCKVNAECWCKNFNGSEYFPGKDESRCENNKCVTCLYD